MSDAAPTRTAPKMATSTIVMREAGNHPANPGETVSAGDEVVLQSNAAYHHVLAGRAKFKTTDDHPAVREAKAKAPKKVKATRGD